MPIEIIPKPRVKKQIKISLFDILYYVVSSLLILCFLAYFGLIYLTHSAEIRLEELKTAIAEKQTKEAQQLENYVLGLKERIDSFAILLNSHRQASNLFEFLAQSCHKNAFFSEVNLDVEKAEAKLAGKTESFKTLGEQILIFWGEDIVRGTSLSQVSLEKEGKIEFDLDLLFNPEIFKYKIPTNY